MLKIRIEKIKTIKYKTLLNNTKISTYEQRVEQIIINAFDDKKQKPGNMSQLCSLFNDVSKKLLEYVSIILGETPFVLSNEIRAMFGHITDYKLDFEHKKANLDKAYNHIRRLTLDALKLLCDQYDLFFSKFLKRYIKYDYKKRAPGFIEDFLSKYFDTRNEYINSQDKESLGSNIQCEIYSSYFKVLCMYIELRKLFVENYAKLRKTKILFWGGRASSIIISALGFLQ